MVYFTKGIWNNIKSYLLFPTLLDSRRDMMYKTSTELKFLYKKLSMKYVSNEIDGFKCDEKLYEWTYSSKPNVFVNKYLLVCNKYMKIKSYIMSRESSVHKRGDLFNYNDRLIRACDRIVSVFSGARVIEKVYHSWYVPKLHELLNVRERIDYDHYVEETRFHLYKKVMFSMFLCRRFIYFSEYNSFTDFDVSEIHLNSPPVNKKRPLRIQRIFQGFQYLPSFYALNHVSTESGFHEPFDDSDYELEDHLKSNFFIPISEEEYSRIVNPSSISNNGNSNGNNINEHGNIVVDLTNYRKCKGLVCDDLYQASITPENVLNVYIDRSKVYA